REYRKWSDSRASAVELRFFAGEEFRDYGEVAFAVPCGYFQCSEPYHPVGSGCRHHQPAFRTIDQHQRSAFNGDERPHQLLGNGIAPSVSAGTVSEEKI